jgi:hypothetical protein
VGNTSDEPDYIDNGEFEWKFTYGDWAGKDESYPWPNTFNLHFAGYSKSGNIGAGATVQYNCSTDVLTIHGYSPGSGAGIPGDNDLMYFPNTKSSVPEGFKGSEGAVPVNMLHTCSWISFLVKGDNMSTGLGTSTYSVKSLKITGIYDTANVTCQGEDIVWSYTNSQSQSYSRTASVTVLSKPISLANTMAFGIEAEDLLNNTVLIPQIPGKLELVYSDGAAEYRREGETALDLKINEDPNLNKWEPGKHYTYTITIKANTIQIEPSPVNWTSGDWGVTVE